MLPLEFLQYLLQPSNVQVDVLISVNPQGIALILLLAFDKVDDAAPCIGDDSKYLRDLFLLQLGLIVCLVVLFTDQRWRREIFYALFVIFVDELGVIYLEEPDAVLAVLSEGPFRLLFAVEECLDFSLILAPLLGITFLGPCDLHKV